MSKRLRDNLSSSYFGAVNKMNPKHSRRRIVAYVESYDDVFFWRSALSSFEDDTRYFEVMLPTHVEHLERGKKAVLMNLLANNVGENMIACVDADYDYLIQGATETSRTILESRYVLHTYVYAIENFQCYAPSLHDVCVAVTLNDHSIFDFEEFMKQFSVAIFPLFVWNIWCYRSIMYGEFTITDFNKVIETGNINLGNTGQIIQNLRRKVDRKIEQLQSRHPKAKESYLEVKNDLRRLGVTPETTYLYIQGHHLFDKVIMPIMQTVCDHLVRERENEIARQSVHNTQYRNELSCYSNSLEDINSMLKKNVGYMRSEPFRQLMADIDDLLNGDTESSEEQVED